MTKQEVAIMKRKIVSMAAILLAILAIFGSGVVTAQENQTTEQTTNETGMTIAQEEQKTVRANVKEKVKEKKQLHQYDVFFYQMEKHRIGMEAVIAYVDESGEGNAGSAQLVVIKGDFVALEGELETAANSGDAKEFQSILKDSRDLTKDFKTEAHNVLGTEGEIGAARGKVNEALEENSEYLDTLLSNIQQSRRESELEIVDEANEVIAERIKTAKGKGGDTGELEENLEEIKEERDELEEKLDAAIASCEGTIIAECETPEAEAYREQREEMKQKYTEIRETSRKVANENRMSKVVDASRKVLEKTQERIATAEEAGADVTVARAKLDEIKGMLDQAEGKAGEGDYEGALEELKNAKGAFKEVQRERIENRIETAKELREEAVEERRAGASGNGDEDEEGGDETDEADEVDESGKNDEAGGKKDLNEQGAK